jgi:thymidylate kinase
MANKVKITIVGATASGKSTIGAAIQKMLSMAGFEVVFRDTLGDPVIPEAEIVQRLVNLSHDASPPFVEIEAVQAARASEEGA